MPTHLTLTGLGEEGAKIGMPVEMATRKIRSDEGVYQHGIVYIRFVGTHEEYDRIDVTRI